MVIGIALVGCGGDPTPDDELECDPSWATHIGAIPGACVRACVIPNENPGDDSCTFTDARGQPETCGAIGGPTAFEGVDGCCHVERRDDPAPGNSSPYIVRWYECL